MKKIDKVLILLTLVSLSLYFIGMFLTKMNLDTIFFVFANNIIWKSIFMFLLIVLGVNLMKYGGHEPLITHFSCIALFFLFSLGDLFLYYFITNKGVLESQITNSFDYFVSNSFGHESHFAFIGYLIGAGIGLVSGLIFVIINQKRNKKNKFLI